VDTSRFTRLIVVWFHREILLPKFYRGPHAITSIVLEAMPEIAQIRVGLLHLFLKHTSASLAITENADRNVLADLEQALDRLAPEDFPYRHSEEGPDDMPSHVKSSLLGCTLLVPINNGRLCLGTWQGICLCEHRREAGRRHIVLTVQGETN
jgi:secondary thiamine-phosphate synthase enzyme